MSMSNLEIQILIYIIHKEDIIYFKKLPYCLIFISENKIVVAITDITLDIYDIKKVLFQYHNKKIRKVYGFSDSEKKINDIEFCLYSKRIKNEFLNTF